jgi:hypothetical protein
MQTKKDLMQTDELVEGKLRNRKKVTPMVGLRRESEPNGESESETRLLAER